MSGRHKLAAIGARPLLTRAWWLSVERKWLGEPIEPTLAVVPPPRQIELVDGEGAVIARLDVSP